METIVQAQEAYNGLSKLLAELTRGLEEFQEGLPSDPEGNPVLPVYGEPGYRFRPENVDQFYNRIGAALDDAVKALVKFKHLQSSRVQAAIKSTALCGFLKDSEWEEAVLADVRAQEAIDPIPLVDRDNIGDREEMDDLTVLEGEMLLWVIRRILQLTT